MQHTKRGLSVAVILVLWSAACGGGAPTSPTPVATTTAPSPPSSPPAPAPDAVTYTIRIGIPSVSQVHAVRRTGSSQRRRLRLEGTISVSTPRSVSHSCRGIGFDHLPISDDAYKALSFEQPIIPGLPFQFDQTIEITNGHPLDAGARAEVRCAARYTNGFGTPEELERFLNVALEQAPPVVSACAPGPDIACLEQGRFQVDVDWRNPAGQTGRGTVMPQRTSDAEAAFWFQTPNNVEAVIKIFNRCPDNQRFWVVIDSPTPWEHTLRVTDVRSGVTQTYASPLGPPPPHFEDRDAFATCPSPAGDARTSP